MICRLHGRQDCSICNAECEEDKKKSNGDHTGGLSLLAALIILWLLAQGSC